MAALLLGMTKPAWGGMTLACHPERMRGISAVRSVEIPRLRLGMTIVAVRLGMTIVASRLGMTVGAALQCEMTIAAFRLGMT
jgi:hypothetical protein